MFPSKSCKPKNAQFLASIFWSNIFWYLGQNSDLCSNLVRPRFGWPNLKVQWFGRTLPNLQVRPIPMPVPIHQSFTTYIWMHLVFDRDLHCTIYGIFFIREVIDSKIEAHQTHEKTKKHVFYLTTLRFWLQFQSVPDHFTIPICWWSNQNADSWTSKIFT